jgi:hypothetical protein
LIGFSGSALSCAPFTSGAVGPFVTECDPLPFDPLPFVARAVAAAPSGFGSGLMLDDGLTLDVALTLDGAGVRLLGRGAEGSALGREAPA